MNLNLKEWNIDFKPWNELTLEKERKKQNWINKNNPLSKRITNLF